MKKVLAFACVMALCLGGFAAAHVLSPPTDVVSLNGLDGPPSLYTCPGGCGDRCVCADPKDCQSQTCSTKPPPYPLPSDGYVEAIAVVERGGTCLLSVGVSESRCDYHADSLPGFEPGVYSCYKDRSGKAMMQILRGSQSATTSASAPVYSSPCANGNCGLQTSTASRRRR